MLAGCATTAGQSFQQFRHDDAQNAITMAQKVVAACGTAQTDACKMAAARIECFTALDQLNLPALPESGQVTGALSAFEVTAETAENVRSGVVPIDVRIKCAPVVVRTNEILIGLGLLAAPK